MTPTLAQQIRLATDGQSPLERAFEHYWRIAGGPELRREYRFDPARKWRFDFAHVESRVAIELEGGTQKKPWHPRGRHVRHDGFVRDCEKYNRATSLGWRVYRIPGGGELERDPDAWIAPVLGMVEGGL